MRILLKCPTRSRPLKIMETLRVYMRLANNPSQMGVVVSCDMDDTTMNREIVHEEIYSICRLAEYKRVFLGNNCTKIEACNADMDKVDYPWDIVVLVSDDMIPQVQGYDDVIRNMMLAKFPDTEGILWFHDGYQGNRLNTLSIYGRKMFDNLYQFLYEPCYRSFYCDTELTDRCNGDLKPKTAYIDYTIIKHEHPGNTLQGNDELYVRNQTHWNKDLYTYISRKHYAYDWSILIPTMTGREKQFASLLSSIRSKLQRFAPTLRYEFCIEYDNREMPIGMKRNILIEKAQGKYISFIDDDDDITEDYILDLVETIKGQFHSMALRGDMAGTPFVHDLDVKVSDPLSDGKVLQRPPNHLNPIYRDIAILIKYENIREQEDFRWAYKLARTGMLTHQYKPSHERPHYIYHLRVGNEWLKNTNTLEHQKKFTLETMLTMSSQVPPPNSVPKQTGLRLTPNGFVSV